MELDVRLGIGVLAEAVDPDGTQPEPGCRCDVVVEARGYVHVRGPRSSGLALEGLPMLVRRLVRADLRRDDRELERHADARERCIDVVAIGVGENRELPAASARVF